MKIKKLPDDVIKKIAAGEVVERPASVVKELVENAIDAGASLIKISIEDAGLKKIVVADDGEGMSRKDVELAIEPHTTSKVTSENDLLTISTLGFRGEALSSIASISNLTITTRSSSEKKGTKIEVRNGKKKITSVGAVTGTTVIIEDLFYSVPARKKFLKKHSTELHKIIDTVTQIALAHPGLGFSLKHDDKSILLFQKNQDFETRVLSVLGQDISRQLLSVESENVKGFIGNPQSVSTSQKRQYLFVNSRPVDNSLIATSVKSAYESLLDKNEHPVFVLSLQIPANQLDINIHPRKETVRFINNKVVQDQIFETVQVTLEENDLTYKKGTSYKGASKPLSKKLREDVIPWSVKDVKEEILQVHNLYLVFQTKEGIVVIDQHAAHERILYEQFQTAFERKKIKVKPPDNPVVFDLPVAEADFVKNNLEVFNQIGIAIESFGDNSFKLSSLPVILEGNDISRIIAEAISDLLNDQRLHSVDSVSDRTISFLACRSAIKAGDVLSQKERRELINKLMSTKTSYTCPHGRPVRINISLNELRKMFKRS